MKKPAFCGPRTLEQLCCGSALGLLGYVILMRSESIRVLRLTSGSNSVLGLSWHRTAVVKWLIRGGMAIRAVDEKADGGALVFVKGDVRKTLAWQTPDVELKVSWAIVSSRKFLL